MSVRLGPYHEYKDSGVPWLGEIPKHWECSPLRRLATIQLSNVDKHTVDGEVPVRLCNYTDVYNRRFITPNVEFMQASALPREIEKFELRKGDVLITKDSESWMDIGVPAYVTTDMPGVLCGYHLAQIRPYSDTLRGGYLLRAFQAEPIAYQFRVGANGVTRFGLSGADIASAMFTVPPQAEQDAIGAFLTHADRRINRLIRAKRCLIELLNEQKQAIIHRAVTRGLDPSVRLKPSGNDWLGDVPAHWEVRKVKQVAQLLVSNVDKISSAKERPIRLCNYTDVYKNELISEKIDFMITSATKDEIAKFRLRIGDVIITKDSEIWNDIGVPALVAYEALDLVCGYHLAILRPDARQMHGEFLLRCFQDRQLVTQLHIQANGITRYGLSQQAIKDCLVPVPPINDQPYICAMLQRDLSGMNAEEDKALREIALLHEYRARLIADVVTGKLDVRGVELPALDEAAGLEEMDIGSDTEPEQMADGEEVVDGEADAGD